MIEVSAGILHAPDGRILICQRGEGRKNAHLWEFPGGKIEAGESPEDCLRRELMEELSLPVTGLKRRCTGEWEGIRFHFIDGATDAAPIPTEHEALRFVTPRELLKYPFCPADVPVARGIALSGIRHAFWDFDGTLLDSYPAMVRAFQAGAAEFGLQTNPVRLLDLMKNCLTHCCETISRESGVPTGMLLAAFRRHEQAELQRGLPPVKGVPEALAAMHRRGVRHYVATHRDLQCRELLDMAGLGGYFTGYVTQEDGLPRKPAPDMPLHLMKKFGLQAEECVMIGDRPLDVESGMAAGIMGILLDPEGRFPGARCDLSIRDAAELADCMRNETSPPVRG